MSLGGSLISPKTAWWDFVTRNKPELSERTAGSKSAGRDNRLTKTVENLKTKKLKESPPNTTKNKIKNYQTD